MGLGGQRNEGLPLEAWAGTMASEPKGLSPRKRRAAEHKRKAKSSRATNKGEEWQSPKEEAKQQSQKEAKKASRQEDQKESQQESR